MRHLLASLASIGSRPASAKARCDLCSSRPRTATSTCGFCHKVTCCCRGSLLWHGLRVLRVLGQAHEHAAMGARRAVEMDPGLSRLAGSPLRNSTEEASITDKPLRPSDRTLQKRNDSCPGSTGTTFRMWALAAVTTGSGCSNRSRCPFRSRPHSRCLVFCLLRQSCRFCCG